MARPWRLRYSPNQSFQVESLQCEQFCCLWRKVWGSTASILFMVRHRFENLEKHGLLVVFNYASAATFHCLQFYANHKSNRTTDLLNHAPNKENGFRGTSALQTVLDAVPVLVHVWNCTWQLLFHSMEHLVSVHDFRSRWLHFFFNLCYFKWSNYIFFEL